MQFFPAYFIVNPLKPSNSLFDFCIEWFQIGAPYFPQLPLTSVGAIFRRTNNKLTSNFYNIFLHKEEEKEKGGWRHNEEKKFTGRRKNGREKY